MEAIIALMEAAVSGEMTLETFVGEYIAVWREFRDENYTAEEALNLKEERVKLAQDVYSGLISKEQFIANTDRLNSKIMGTRIRPGSREDEIISHIMVEADAYEADPQMRNAHQIGENEFLADVNKALLELRAIHLRNLSGKFSSEK